MMVKTKKKQTRSQSLTEKTPKKTLEPKLLSIFHSKLESGKDMKHMLRGMSSKPAPGLSSQSRVVRCPKCHKLLQVPVDVTIYTCSECDSVPQAKRWQQENKDNSNPPEDLISSQNRSLSTKIESEEGGGSKTPVRTTYRKYSSRALPCVERGYHSETAYRRHETTPYIRREWLTRGDAFSSARSCSGVVKLSITKKQDTTLLDLLKFVDSGTSSVNLETSEDKGTKEIDTRRSISSDFYELKPEAFQPQWKPASSENTPRRIHLEQSKEGGSKTPVRSTYRKFSSRASSPLFERSYHSETAYRCHETTSYIRREWMRSASASPSSYGYTSSPFHGSQVSASDQSYHQREGWFQEFSSASASPMRFQGETSDHKYYHWSSQQSQMPDSQLSIRKKEDSTLLDLFGFVDSGTSFAEETVVVTHHHDSASDSHQLSSSDKGSGDRVCISTEAVTWETFDEEKGIKENIRSISSKFIDLTFQPRWNYKLRTQASLLGDGSGEILAYKNERMSDSTETVADRLVEHVCLTNALSENTRDTQEFDLGELKWEDIMGETGEERSVFQHMESPNENVDNSYEGLETVYGGERTWAETMEDRVGLHLEEYETNYENYSNPFEWTSKAFHMPEYELETILEPEEEAQGRSESSSRSSFSDQESSEGSSVIGQDAKPDQSQYKKSSERQELSNAIFDIVRSELQEGRYHQTNETFDRRGYASETTWTEKMGYGPGLQLEEHQNNNSHEWTSERAPTFPLHEHKLGTMSEPEEDVSEISTSSSKNVFDDHEGSKERAVAHEEEPWLVDENKTKEIKVGVKVEDGPSFHLEKCGYESTTLEDTFGLTETTPTFCLHEPELLEPDDEADGSSESSSRSSFNSHESSKLRAVFHQEEEPQVMSDSRAEIVSVKLEDIFEWTSERAPTFRLYEPELGAVLEPEEEAQGRSESSSKGSFNDQVVSKEREMYHEEKFENEKMLLDQRVEPREDIFRLSLDDTLEQEWATFDSETSQGDKEVNLRQTFKQGDTEENIPASGSMISSEVESEAEEEILRGHLEHLQEENEKSRLTPEASEVVGLRHALYQTQTPPLRSPLTSPILTPIGSPRHILMRSRTASPMHSHIVSPLRSSIDLSGSLSDVLFFGKKA